MKNSQIFPFNKNIINEIKDAAGADYVVTEPDILKQYDRDASLALILKT
jgi:hypothetical protein